MREKANIYRYSRVLDDRGVPTDTRVDVRVGTWLIDILETSQDAILTTGEVTTVRGYKAKVRYKATQVIRDLDLIEFRGKVLTIRTATEFNEGRNRYQMLKIESGE